MLEHGADPFKQHERSQETAFELANKHCQMDQVKMILMNTKRLHHHPVLTETSKRQQSHDPDGIVDSSKYNVGCCGSMWGFCGM